MKKLISLFMAIAFALSFSVAIAQEKAPTTPSDQAPATSEKAPAKTKKHKKTKKSKKEKKETPPPAETPTTK